MSSVKPEMSEAVSSDSLDAKIDLKDPRWTLAFADLAQLLVIGAVLHILLFDGTQFGVLFRLGVLALLLIGVNRSQAWPTLIAFQCKLFLGERRRSELVIDPADFLYVVAVLAVLAYASCFSLIRHRVSRFLVRMATAAMEPFRENKTSEAMQLDWLGRGVGLSKRMLAISIAVLVSILSLSQLPLTASSKIEWFQRSVADGFTLWPGPTLLVSIFALAIVLTESGWRQMTPAQARLFLRSTYVSDHWSDLKMILTRRFKRTGVLMKGTGAGSAVVEPPSEPFRHP